MTEMVGMGMRVAALVAILRNTKKKKKNLSISKVCLYLVFKLFT